MSVEFCLLGFGFADLLGYGCRGIWWYDCLPLCCYQTMQWLHHRPLVVSCHRLRRRTPRLCFLKSLALLRALLSSHAVVLLDIPIIRLAMAPRPHGCCAGPTSPPTDNL